MIRRDWTCATPFKIPICCCDTPKRRRPSPGGSTRPIFKSQKHNLSPMHTTHVRCSCWSPFPLFCFISFTVPMMDIVKAFHQPPTCPRREYVCLNVHRVRLINSKSPRMLPRNTTSSTCSSRSLGQSSIWYLKLYIYIFHVPYLFNDWVDLIYIYIYSFYYYSHVSLFSFLLSYWLHTWNYSWMGDDTTTAITTVLGVVFFSVYFPTFRMVVRFCSSILGTRNTCCVAAGAICILRMTHGSLEVITPDPKNSYCASKHRTHWTPSQSPHNSRSIVHLRDRKTYRERVHTCQIPLY